jgi:regulation of enolase protein 1 (concanavalin A-like superfamily)
MRRWLWLLLALVTTVASGQRPTTFAWNPGAGWPAGTTVELCGNGPTCLDGITGTQATLLLPVSPGAVIEGRARAVPPPGYLCGDPPALCPKSDWASVALTWPLPARAVVANLGPVPPTLWASSDVGTTLPGSVAVDGGEFTVVGNGADIWGSSDAFHFVHQPLTGDGSIVARVASLTNTHSWAKAGVMIRENLDANARHAMAVVTRSNGVAFQRRASTGGSSAHTAGGAVVVPYWVRLTRAGNTFTAHQSANGSTWTQVGSAVTIAMGATAQVGLAVTSHDAAVTTTAVFTNVITE